METSVLAENLDEVVLALNQFYLLIMGVIVFSMQIGFTLLEAGGVRKKNVNNILTKVSSLTSLTARTFSTAWSAQFATG
jgi:ammonia channel protein AmtB